MSDQNENGDWYSSEASTFGARLVGARDAAGLSRNELARRLGVQAKTLRKWEEDMAEPRANKLQLVAGVLNVSIMWLLNGEGDGVDAEGRATTETIDLSAVLDRLREMQRVLLHQADEVERLENQLAGLLEPTS